MSTLPYPLVFAFPAVYTGQAANVRYLIKDSGGNVVSTVAAGSLTEDTDEDGVLIPAQYVGTGALDPTWAYPLTARATIVGSPGTAATERIGVPISFYPQGIDPESRILAATVDTGVNGTLTVKDSFLLTFLSTIGQFGSPVRSTSAPYTVTVPFLRLDGTTTALTYVTTYTDSTFTKPTGRTFAFGTLPS